MKSDLRMPPEWAPHAACWMAWPCNRRLWGEGLAAARRASAGVARAIAQYEPVNMVANREDIEEARRLCGDSVRLIALPIGDSWMRDTGPTFVRDAAGRLSGVDWQFNDYGNKHHDPAEAYYEETQLARRILQHLDIPRISAPLVLEGGSIHVDGEGSLLTSEQCLLNPNRNPDLSRAQIEQYLMDYLGVRRVIWLGQGLRDDDTDGHVDNLACFARPGVVLALTCNDPDDDNYHALQDNLQRLRAARDACGRALEVIEIEQPEPRMNGDLRLAMSYINFYLANGAVILPAFGQPHYDDAAAAVVARVFADRQVVQVAGIDIIPGGGNVHCITQQQPLEGVK